MTNYISTPLSTLNEDLNAIQTALSSKADKSELANYAQLSDIPEVPEGDYLPLSGGNLSGRIYLKTSQSQVVGSNAVLTASESYTIYVGSWDESVELTANVTLSVMNAGQDFIDMISNSEEYTGDELTSYTVNAKIQFVGPNGLNKTLNGSTTIGFGYHYVSDNSIDFGDSLDADLGHEDESALVFNELAFNMGSGGDNPTFVLHFNVDGDPYDFSQDDFGYSDIWTVEEIREEVETIEPFVLSSEIPEVPEDLSSFTNSPGFATSSYVQEHYVPISAFNDIFQLGEDATSADMLSTINALIDALKGETPTPTYVQDGLIGWWDGIWNNGVNNHSDSTTTWKDLKGSNDLTYDGTASGKWDSNSFTFNNTYAFYSMNADINSQIRNGWTAECVYNFTASRSGNDGVFGSRYTSGYGIAPEGIYGNCNGGNNAQCGVGHDSNDMKIGNTPALTTITTLNTIHYIAIVFDPSNNEQKVYHNGTLLATKSGASWTTSDTPTVYMIGRAYANGREPPGGSTSDRSFEGKVYVNRIYSRVLTAEEIASNYQLDKTRYNLT